MTDHAHSVVHLQTDEPVTLAFRYEELGPEEDAPAPGRLLTMIPIEGSTDRIICRLPADDDTAKHIAELLVKRPRILLYQGADAPPGIFGMLYALIDANEMEGEEWKGEGETAGIFLGVVVRYQHDMPANLRFQDQCVRHFAAIMAGKTVSQVDKALEALMKGPGNG